MKRIMSKAVILLIVLCMAAGSVMVHAENFDVKDTIAFGQTRIVTIPKPEGEIDPAFIYFNQEFTFVPEEDGTYRFLVSYQEDEAKPYDIFMDVVGAYRELENGCEFDAVAGQTYNLCFQYPIHDGRYPTFTFYVGAADADVVPKTGEAVGSLPDMNTILLCAGGAAMVCALVVLLIAEKKKNMNPDPL